MLIFTNYNVALKPCLCLKLHKLILKQVILMVITCRVDNDDFTSGGQCEDGLKMIVVIGETEFVISGNRYDGDNLGHDPDPPPPTQLAAAGEQV